MSKNSYIWFFVEFQVAIKFVDKRSVKDLREVSPKQQITFRRAGLNHVNLGRQPRYVNFA